MDATIRFRGIWLDTPAGVLEARVQARSRDASDATVEVIRQQLRNVEKPADWSALDAAGPSAQILAGARETLSSETAAPNGQ